MNEESEKENEIQEAATHLTEGMEEEEGIGWEGGGADLTSDKEMLPPPESLSSPSQGLLLSPIFGAAMDVLQFACEFGELFLSHVAEVGEKDAARIEWSTREVGYFSNPLGQAQITVSNSTQFNTMGVGFASSKGNGQREGDQGCLEIRGCGPHFQLTGPSPDSYYFCSEY